MITTVYELGTNKKQLFALPPMEAVVCAYAQSNGDFNTWDYRKYDNYVVFPGIFVSCGNFTALVCLCSE